jgi:cell division protein FtsB
MAAGAILLFSFLGPGGYRVLRRARTDLQLRRAHVDSLKRSNSDRIKEIESLRSDKEALEKYAREKGYGREGDLVQELPAKSDSQEK